MSGAAAAINFKTFKELLIIRRGHLLIIQFNRPEVQNALRRRTIYELLRALDIANADSGISVIVLTGNEVAFTSGNDLTDLLELQRRNGDQALDRFVHFTPESNVQRHQLKDGGVAIVDQLICSFARHFVGTYESTFTYRIYEEREILGFSKSSTFNTFCKALGGNCARNAIWPIVWNDDDDKFY